MSRDKVLSKIKETFLNDIRPLDIFKYIEEEDVGYFGRIGSIEFITYEKLNELLGLVDGEDTDDMDWLCFWYKGSLLFISQHPVKVGVSWNRLNELKLVDGSTTVEINNNEYSVMLPTGGNIDSSGKNNMWDDLIVRVHKDDKTWDNLTNADLSVNVHVCKFGSATLCQEKHVENNKLMICRGYPYITSLGFNKLDCDRDTRHGTRIVLKLNLDKPNKVRHDITNDGEKIVNVTNIKYNKAKHSPCKVCGDIGSYYDDNDKLVKCCDPISNKLDQDESGYYRVKLGSINTINHNGVEHVLNKKLKYDKYMMDTASIWKQLSVCKRNQVGCVIGTDDGRILVNGYNGTISKTDNNCEEICNVCNGENKDCSRCGGKGIISSKFVVHAEQNAITFAAKEGIKLKGTTLYTTTSPCPDCAKLIASTGIKRVLYLDEYKDTSGVDFLNHCGVSCYKI